MKVKAQFVMTKKAVSLTIKMALYDASVKMVIWGNLVVSNKLISYPRRNSVNSMYRLMPKLSFLYNRANQKLRPTFC